MNYLDIIIIIPLLWGAYKGFSKGLITELSGLVALYLGVWGAIKFSDFTGVKLNNLFELNSEYLPVISFAITFIAIVIAVHLLSKLLDKIIKSAALGIVNRIAGIVFGIAKFVIIIGVIIILINKFDKNSKFISKEKKESSILYSNIEKLILTIYPSVNDLLNNYVFNEEQPKTEE